MARVKSPRRNHRKKVMKAAKGFVAARRRRFKAASEAVWHAGQYAYAGRRLRKRDLRALWIERLNAAVRMHDMSYSRFISALKKSNVTLDRKILSDIAISDPESFKQIVSQVK
jgi:large subunit ribosomal protein L20